MISKTKTDTRNHIRSDRARRGFTLIELLVVVAIIAILVSFLLPSLARARDRAKQMACQSNLHNIGQASVMYANDFQGFVPRGNNLLWYQAFMPYLPEGGTSSDFRDVKIYRCPSYPDQRQTVCYVDSSWAFAGRSDMVGYEINEPTKLTRFDRLNETIYLADNEYGWWRPIITGRNDPELSRNDVWTPSHLPSSNVEEITYGRRVARNRHLGGADVMYFDGHAGWVGPYTMTVDMWRDNWH